MNAKPARPDFLVGLVYDSLKWSGHDLAAEALAPVYDAIAKNEELSLADLRRHLHALGLELAPPMDDD